MGGKAVGVCVCVCVCVCVGPDYSSPSSATIKKELSCISTFQYDFMTCKRSNFHLPYIFETAVMLH